MDRRVGMPGWISCLAGCLTMCALRHRLLVIAAAGALGLPATPALAATWVSYPVLLAQVRSGPLIRAIINPGRGDVEIKFRDLSEWHAFYPAGEQPTLQRLLYARHIRVLFVPRHQASKARPATVHHHLRYIAAGVIGAAAAIGAGFLLYRRRHGAGPSRP
jgi:hypothetical protein